MTEDLFKPQVLPESGLGAELPYDESADALDLMVIAREGAVGSKKFLMMTFGANWCMDCRNLHRSLSSQEVSTYTSGLFDFVNIDVGKFNKKMDVAAKLRVALTRGIPVAIVFDPEGNVIGTTND